MRARAHTHMHAFIRTYIQASGVLTQVKEAQLKKQGREVDNKALDAYRDQVRLLEP